MKAGAIVRIFAVTIVASVPAVAGTRIYNRDHIREIEAEVARAGTLTESVEFYKPVEITGQDKSAKPTGFGSPAKLAKAAKTVEVNVDATSIFWTVGLFLGILFMVVVLFYFLLLVFPLVFMVLVLLSGILLPLAIFFMAIPLLLSFPVLILILAILWFFFPSIIQINVVRTPAPAQTNADEPIGASGPAEPAGTSEPAGAIEPPKND